MQGVILIDKPEGFTSFDVVAVIRKLAGIKKVGHTGTLDPMATGVLPILIGRATKLADLLPEHNKRYTAVFRLGLETDTLDITGRITAQHEVKAWPEDVQHVLGMFQGAIMQTPPMYSAVQKNGVRLYDLARKGIEVEREQREITIHSLCLTDAWPDDNEYEIDVLCSKGTYIRSLCADIGRTLGCGAVLTKLRRTQACGYTIDGCTPLEQVREQGIASVLRPAQTLLLAYPCVAVSAAQAVRFQNGGSLSLDRVRLTQTDKELYRVCDPNGSCVGVGQIDPERNVLKMRCLLEIDRGEND